LLADRYYGSYWELALARQRGADVVGRLHQRRRPDFRRGRRLGREDHVARWAKPERPAWMDTATYAALPAALAVRELRLPGRHPGFRPPVLGAATPQPAAAALPREERAVVHLVRGQRARR